MKTSNMNRYWKLRRELQDMEAEREAFLQMRNHVERKISAIESAMESTTSEVYAITKLLEGGDNE